MVDPLSEQLISLTEAASLLPRRRRGRKASPSTCYRWSQTGVRGVVLETVQVGGTRCTSREALARFFAALSNLDSPKSAPVATPARRKQQVEKAEAYCKKAGT